MTTQAKRTLPLKKLLSLLLALVMVVGLLPVGALAADENTEISIEAFPAALTQVGTLNNNNDVYMVSLDSNVESFKFTCLTMVSAFTSDALANGVADATVTRSSDHFTAAQGYFQTNSSNISGIETHDNYDYLLFSIGDLDWSTFGYYTLGYLIVEWEKGAAVVKSELQKAIVSVPTSGYYTDDDRYNGKETSANGFWEDMRMALAAANTVNANASALQSEVNNAAATLTAAIAKLIPADQVNATALYEAVNSDWRWNGMLQIVDGTKPGNQFPDRISADNTTAATWEPYAKALAEGEAELAKLFDDGTATEYNQAALQDSIDELAAAIAPNGLVNKELYAERYNWYIQHRDEALTLLTQYDPAKLEEDNFTEQSWDTYMTAYNALKTDLQYKVVGGTKADMDMLNGFRGEYGYWDGDRYISVTGHLDALKAARRQLTSKVDITVSFTYINNFAARYPLIREFGNGEELYVNEALTLQAADATVAGAISKSGITFVKSDDTGFHTLLPGGYQNIGDINPLFAVYVNGEYYKMIHNNVLNSPENAIQLHDGDEVRVVRIAPLTAELEASSGLTSTIVEEYMISDSQEYQRSLAVIEMAEPREELRVGDKAEFSASVTGADGTNFGDVLRADGITLFVSEPNEEAVISQPTIQTTAVTDANGKLEYVFAEPGWYTVLMQSVRPDVLTFTDVYNVVTYGDYYSLYAGDYALIEVKAVDDMPTLMASYRNDCRAKADAYFQSYQEHDFASGFYEDTFKTQYNTLKTNLDDAETFKALKDGFDADFAQLQEYGTVAIDHAALLAHLRSDMILLPSDLAAIDESYSALVEGIQTTYSSMNDYQKLMLSQDEINLLNRLAAMKLDELVRLAKVTVNVSVDGSIPNASDDGAANFGWPNLTWNMHPQPDGTVPTPARWDNLSATPKDAVISAKAGDHVFIRRYFPDSDAAYRMMWSLDGITWNAAQMQTLVNQHGSIYDDYHLAEYVIPENAEDGSAVNIRLKVFSKTEYEDWVAAKDATKLPAAKESACAALDAAYAGYDLSKYDEAGKAALDDALTSGKTDVNSATTLAAVTEARKAAIAAMAAVARKPAEGGQEQQQATYPSGDIVGQVHVTIENSTFAETPFTGEIVSGWYDLGENDSMMTVVLKALQSEGYSWNGTVDFGPDHEADYTITYLSSIVMGEDSLAEFDGGQKSGWMGTLNEWFVNEGFNMFSVANGKLENGDDIHVMYTCDYGADIGGTWDSSNTALKSLEITGGTLTPAFDSGITDYMLVIDSERTNVTVKPTPANKNYQHRIFLNSYNVDSAMYKRTETMSVKSGDTIYVGVGESGWPSMNTGGKATKYSVKVYSLENAIAALPAASVVNSNNYKTYQKTVEALEALASSYSGDKAKLTALKEKVEFFAQIDNVKTLLAAINTPYNAGEVRAARNAYDALSGEQEKYIIKADTAKFNAAVEWLAAYDASFDVAPIIASKEAPVEGTEVAPAATVDSTGAAKAEVSAEAMDSIIENAKTAASEGASTEAPTVVIKPEIEGEASKVAVELPAASVETLAKDTAAALAVETELGSVSISNEALSSIAAQAEGESIRIEIEEGKAEQVKAALAADPTTALDEAELKDAVITEVTVYSGERQITSFGGAELTLELPATKNHVEGKTYLVLAISDDGTVSQMIGRMVNGKLIVKTTHLTTFIATTEEANPFTDIENHWAAEAIQYAFANGLMSGVADTLFDPNGTVTRAMVVTVLHNMENKPAAKGESPFTDVEADAWYTDAVLWAAENRIVEGADGKFSPTDAVTREQFAAMLYRYAAYKKYDVSKLNDLTAYTDAAEISDWAKTAMQWANAANLITGRTATTLVPTGTATRAEMASIMMRFCEGAAK